VSITETSDAVNAGMAIQAEGRRIAPRASLRPQLDLWLVGFSPVILHTYPPMKMEQIECSETSAYKVQTPGNHPEESMQRKRITTEVAKTSVCNYKACISLNEVNILIRSLDFRDEW